MEGIKNASFLKFGSKSGILPETTTAKSYLEQQGEFQPFIQGLSQGQKELITSIMNGYCKEYTAQLIKRYRDWKEETQYFKDLLEEIGVFIDWDRQV